MEASYNEQEIEERRAYKIAKKEDYRELIRIQDEERREQKEKMRKMNERRRRMANDSD
jgi:hypothetical protein